MPDKHPESAEKVRASTAVSSRKAILEIVGTYAVVGSLWIYFSDTALSWFVSDPLTMTRIAVFKGIAFIAFTALLLYVLIAGHMRTREKAAKELAASEIRSRELAERLRLLSDNIPDSMVYQVVCRPDDDSRRFTYVSEGVRKLHGISPEEVMGDSGLLYMQIAPEDRERLAENEARSIAAMTTFKAEVTICLPDGALKRVLIFSSPRKDELGNILWDGIELDITERKRLEDRLLQAQKLEAVGTLAGGIAHDFNNILSAIMGYGELALPLAPQGSELQKYLSEILRGSLRARDLVSQILTFSRKSNEALEAVHLEPVINEVVSLLRSATPSYIEIIWEHPAKPVPATLATPTQLHQIAMNLGTNASQAMARKKGRITFSLEYKELPETQAKRLGIPPASYVALSVQDEGPGIPKEYRDKIFDPFFTTKPKGEGTGLGLSVVHGIVSGNGGAVDIDTAPGEGARFTVFLPIAKSLPATSSEAVSAQKSQESPGAVLIVDDEPSLATLAAASLSKHGHKTHAFSNPSEALDLLLQDPSQWDVLVTDQTMPEMTGDQLLAKIREAGLNIPVIVWSGHSDVVGPENAESIGFFTFIQKPFSQDELLGAVAAALRHGRNDRSHF